MRRHFKSFSLAILTGVMASGSIQTLHAMGDPSIAYCEEEGGRVGQVATRDGTMGVCVLPDDVMVELWAYYYNRSTDVHVQDEEERKADRFCHLAGGMTRYDENGSGQTLCVTTDPASGETQELLALDSYWRWNTNYQTKEPVEGPATEYCRESGGKPQAVQQLDWQIGLCLLPDGTVVEEWDHFNAAGGLWR